MIKHTYIQHILTSPSSFHEKLHQLRWFFEKEHVRYFCDFDDTITKNTCLLYSKFNYLTRKKHFWLDKTFDILHSDFVINPKFVSLITTLWIKEIVVVSSNNLEFLTKMIYEKKAIFDRLWLSIVGIVAKTPNFDFWPKDKYKIFPKHAVYISDIFEHKNFLWNDWFVCVDRYSFFNYYYIFCKKILFYLLFLIKHV